MQKGRLSFEPGMRASETEEDRWSLDQGVINRL